MSMALITALEVPFLSSLCLMAEARALVYGPRALCSWSSRRLDIEHAQILIWIVELVFFSDESYFFEVEI
jgi:hypothetical protein